MASAPFLAEKICYLREVQVVEIGVKASHRIKFIRKISDIGQNEQECTYIESVLELVSKINR